MHSIYTHHLKQIRIGSIHTSDVELKDILKAWLAVSAAFAIVFYGGIAFSFSFYYLFILASLTVGIGFFAHEMAHKITAQHYGCFAEFRAFGFMLILAIAMSFFGFVFAAPGAVMIAGPIGKRRNGKISMAGPLANIILGILLFAVLLLSPPAIIMPFLIIGFFVNSFMALFNLIPFGNFDGRKILIWNKIAYGIMAAVSVALFLISQHYYGRYGVI